jgi:DNA modification methylase
MAGLPEASVDAIVTDPPYGLEFMGKAWDSFGGGAKFTKPGIGERDTPWPSFTDNGFGGANPTCAGCGGRLRGGKKCSCDKPDWRVKGEAIDPKNQKHRQMLHFQESMQKVFTEALRVAKPGAHLLAFGGTRTHHRLMAAIEDAGWEIRDCVMWVYGSGFPKSLNVEKAGAGAEWQGWGTALKPAWEPIIVARKPLIGTVAANVQTFGTGALNIDASRVAPSEEVLHTPQSDPTKRSGVVGADLGISNSGVDSFQEAQRASIERTNTLGRWPANLIHDGSEEVVGLFPQTTSRPHAGAQLSGAGTHEGWSRQSHKKDYPKWSPHNDSGSAARFFYCAKASKKDRELGLTDTAPLMTAADMVDRTEGSKNNHPTVKPTDLMRYLCRLVTPPGGTVLDPFCGSGSTGVAARLEGFDFIGIDADPQWAEVARQRCEGVSVA